MVITTNLYVACKRLNSALQTLPIYTATSLNARKINGCTLGLLARTGVYRNDMIMMPKEVRMHIGVYCMQAMPGIVIKPTIDLCGVYAHSWLLHATVIRLLPSMVVKMASFGGRRKGKFD